MTVSAAGLVEWTPTVGQVGDHEVTLYADDGQGRALLSYSITITSDPVPLATTITVTPEFVNPGETVTISVLTTGGQGAVTTLLLVDNVEIPLDGNGQAEITAAASGSHTIEVAVSDGVDTVVETTGYSVRDPGDTEAPVVSITSPESDTEVNSPVGITGTVEDANLASYQVMLSPRGKQAWQVIAEGDQPVNNSLLATLDPTLLMNGQYDVLLLAEDVNGEQSYDGIVLLVEGDLKVGNFSITLEDLNVPVMGIPIRVTRTYDSRRRSEDLDFGYGWSVGYQDAKVEESRTPGKFWVINEYRYGPLSALVDFCVEPLGAPLITVTLPDGDVEKFEMSASPRCNQFTVVKNVTLELTAVGDTQSTLEVIGDNTARFEGGTLLESIESLLPVDPENYKLTTQAGYEYHLNQDFGIVKVTDPNGQTLTYTDDGIFHSSGKSVTFNRNADGHITSITDPKGEELTYTYNTDKDLSASIDTVSQATTYSYNRNHGLLEITDPLGRSIVRNIYDDDGRLIAQEDNAGHRTEFSHDIAGRQSVVTDRNNNTTFYYYDDRGNVTSKVDALGHTWSYTHDERGNQLSETNPLGYASSAVYDDRNNQLTQTDPLGNTVSFTYNTRGQELTIQDALGNTFTNTYDTVGNLLTVKDPLNNLAGNNINAQGLVSSTVDANSNVTSYTYDDDGNKLTETNALSEVTTFTYDANGNVLSESRTRTVNGAAVTETTGYTYDARNRITRTDYTDGTFTRSEYDEVGNEIASIDPKGRRTEMDYDVYGRLTETRYPDGSAASKTYDPEGNLLTDTDRAGRTTSYTYDSLNRVESTTYADGSVTRTEYDAAGRVTSETDARGNRSSYEYDAAGRRTSVVDAQGNRHTFVYDANGNLISETDANLHTTSYTYNALDQRISTTYHNSSSTGETYDALGRRTVQTDQADKTTRYEYDKLGRLQKVIDALNQETTYSYDEAGNKLTQTDAEGRITRWTYDSMGRVLSRTLPLGQVESFSYDATGNLLSHTDFNGATSTYTYDLMDRLLRTDYTDGNFETYTYDVSGNRLTATSENGTTGYSYDVMNRLIREEQPNGAVTTYTYDAAGNRTEVVLAYGGSSYTTTYTYDVLNRLSSVKDAANGETLYTYDSVGNRETVTLANGNTSYYLYDSLNRLTHLETQKSDSTVLQSYDYTLHPTGRRTQIDELDGRSTQYTYDDLYRLTGESVTDLTNGNYAAEYQFDKVGNRVYSIIDGVHTAFTYDANDRLTQQGGISYSYDNNGNTLTETEDSLTTSYSYNDRNQMVEVMQPDTTTSTYQYNVDGIREAKTEGGITTTFVVDQNRDYAQVLIEDNGTDRVLYTYGDDLVSQSRNRANSYYLYDGLGSTRGLSDGSGNLTDSYNYDAFGILLNSTGSTENSYRFAGEQFDSALDQYYLRARYYNQGVGRFTQMDTFQGWDEDPTTLHKYLYANVDPANGIDPSGHMTMSGLMSGVNGFARLALAAVPRYQAIGKVASGLVGAGLGYLISDELKDFIATNAPAMNRILEEKRAREEARVETRSRGRRPLFHYTDRISAALIGASGVGFVTPSFRGLGTNGNTRPAGFYATDIAPWEVNMTQADLSALFYGGNRHKDVSWFVAVDASLFSPVYGAPREYVYHGSTGIGRVDLDVITIGPNLMLPGL